MNFAFMTFVVLRLSSVAEVPPRVSPVCRLFLSWALCSQSPLRRLCILHQLPLRLPVRSTVAGFPRGIFGIAPVARERRRRLSDVFFRVPSSAFLRPRRFALVKARGCFATRRRPWGSKCFLGMSLNRSTRIAPCRHQTSTPTPHLACSPFEGSPSPTALRSRDRRCPPAVATPLHPGASSSRKAGFPANARREGHPRRPTARCGRTQNRTRSPVSRPPWCLHGPVRPTQTPRSIGRNRFLLHLHRAGWLWRADPKGYLGTDTRAVFPGGSSHAVREPVPADVFADRVAPAVCKQKMRCALFPTGSAYRPTPVVSNAAGWQPTWTGFRALRRGPSIGAPLVPVLYAGPRGAPPPYGGVTTVRRTTQRAGCGTSLGPESMVTEATIDAAS